jgi:acyl dehydratase
MRELPMRTIDGLPELPELSGADLGSSDWIVVDQQRIDLFADASGDHQWIHVDPERAAAGPFGQTIAHGYVTLALVVPLHRLSGYVSDGGNAPTAFGCVRRSR